MRVLIVGAGCTGSATALSLRRRLGDSALIHVWDKARGAGGRFTTSRDAYPNGLRADMGAQYASLNPNDAESSAIMDQIVAEGAAELVDDAHLVKTAERPQGTRQYRGVEGQNGIVKAMLSMAKADVAFERRVSKLDRKARTWTATARDGTVQDFNCVILAVPGCGPGGDNLNKIHGNWEKQLTDANWKDVEVPHDCRYSVALWLEPGHQRSLECFFGDAVEKRLDGDGVELLIWQSRKDGEPLEGPQVLVAHTEQGARGNKQQAEPRMSRGMCNAVKIPHKAITSSKIITWFQSQVQSVTAQSNCLVACDAPPLVLAGDYFTASTFTGCVQSATAAAEAAAALLSGKGSPGEAKQHNDSKVTATTDNQKQLAGSGGYAKPGGTECCSWCKKQRKCFLDKTDGARYCSQCWKSYYGTSPAAGA